MKEFPNGSKNKWTRIFKKKWFFPAVYIVIAAFLLTGVIWYQNTQSNLIEGLDEVGQTDSYEPSSFDKEEAEAVLQQSETIKMPVKEETKTEIVTKFYDYNKDEEEQEKAVTFYNNRYYQSTGIDIAASDGETFDVVASLSGEVMEVKEDPLHGNVVVMDHGDDITTYYASLDEVTVDAGTKIKQGEKIGTAGQNLYSEESGKHVHFEIRKEDTEINPEDFFNKTLTSLIEFDLQAGEESVEQEMDSDSEAENPNGMKEEDPDMSNDPEEEKQPNSNDDGSDQDEQDNPEADDEENISFSINA